MRLIRMLLALCLSLLLVAPAWATFTTYNENLTGGPNLVFATDAQIIANATQGQGWSSGGVLTAQGTPDMTVALTAGTAWNGVGVSFNFVTSDAVSALAIAAADPDWPRIDLVSVPFTSTTPTPIVTTGVAYAVPVPPDLPVNSGRPNVALWYVIVPAGAAAITSDLLMDKRMAVGAFPFVGQDGTVPSLRLQGLSPSVQCRSMRGTLVAPTTSTVNDTCAMTFSFVDSVNVFAQGSAVRSEVTSTSTGSLKATLYLDSDEVKVNNAFGLSRLNLTSVPAAVEVTNEGTTGTTLNKIAKLTGAPTTAVIATTSDTTGVIGIVAAGAGTTGKAQIARLGTASCVFDGATTAGHYVTVSTTVTGDCRAFGATPPTDGSTILGRVLSTNGAGGTYAVLVDEPAIGRGGGNPETWAVVANDVTHAQSDTTLSNVTGMSVAICTASTEVWQIEATLIWTAANITVDIKYGWTFPTGVTMLWAPISTANTSLFFNPGGTATTPDALLDQTATYAHGSGNFTGGLLLKGIVYCSTTSGTLQLQFAQFLSNASDVTIKKGSLLIARKVIP